MTDRYYSSPTEYGSLISKAGRLIVTTDGVYMRDIAFLLETGQADAATLAAWVDGPKMELEYFERELAGCKPPRDLKKFHSCFERGVRGTILKWGSLRRAGLGSAQQFGSLAIVQFGVASQELGRLSRKMPDLLSSLELDSQLIGVLWRDIDWLEHSSAKADESFDGDRTSGIACSSCGHPAGPEARFCVECGHEIAPLSPRCAECGKASVPGAKFCSSCGHKLTP